MKPSILLHTKFLVPRTGLDQLPRPHLVARLEAHLDRPLILISAPAGYGKTTLLAEFAATTHLPIAWYQLDSADSDPAVFLTYLIEALRQTSPLPVYTRPTIGEAARAVLDSADTSVPALRVLTVLINELAETLHEDWVFILEDYLLVTNPVIHQLVDYLLENTPPGVHVILSTRVDPPLPLARWRARGELAELRAGDLRFTQEEVRGWLARSVPGISSESAQTLGEKTEGWAAALQIVSSSLNGTDPSSAAAFIANLSGTHRDIFEYLTEEVLRRQPAPRQQFLLRTAVLSQMDAQACNALPGVERAQEALDQLEAENLFLTSLDPDRRWYRYHHLFREYLLGRLRRDEPALLIELERAAGDYYTAQGELEAAFNHFLRARDFNRAARAIQGFAPAYVERGRVEVLHRYLSALPASVVRNHPDLLLQHGNVLRRLGQAGGARAHYEDAHQAFTNQGDLAGISRALSRLAEVNRSQGNYRRAEALAREAVEQAPADDHAGRADALMALAKSVGFLTGMDQGRSLAEQAVEAARQAGEHISPLARANLLQALGQICWWHGDPQATVRYCQEALQTAPESLSPIAARAYLSMATPYLYWRDLNTALLFAEQGLEIAQTLHLIETLPSAYTILGNVLTRRGETARAENTLRQAMQMAQDLGLASYERVMATGYLAYNLYGQGRVDEARQLAEGSLWSYTGNPDTYEVFVCRSVLADVALESDRLERAETLFEELLAVGIRRQFRIPLAMVYFGLAYIHLVTGRGQSGIAMAQQAQALIEPTQAVQLYLDQGERSRVVCRALLASGFRSSFLHRVLDALPEEPSVPQLEIPSGAVNVQCLGAFQVSLGGEEFTQDRWVSTKARDLLAYFITFRGERVPAERAFDAIWGGKSGRGMTAFHTALSRLRSALRQGQQQTKFILVEAGDNWLDAARFNMDVDEFDNALAKARVAVDEAAAMRWYRQAISVYQGEYLANLYYDWVFPERRRLTKAYLSALCTLADHHMASGQPEDALQLLQLALQVDPLLEAGYCQAMRAHAALGDRAGLVRQYQHLEQALAEELDVKPLPDTRELFETLLAQM